MNPTLNIQDLKTLCVLDLDDFHEYNCPWVELHTLKRKFPNFKATLFTIPGRCSKEFVAYCLQHSWLDFVPHGWMHRTSLESEKWSAGQMHEALDNAERLGFTTKGFKAPGWQISTACYSVLLERGYWAADQAYNNWRRPAALPVYLLDQPWKIHGHVGSRMGNDLTKLLPHLLETPETIKFGFVRDHLICSTTSSSLIMV